MKLNLLQPKDKFLQPLFLLRPLSCDIFDSIENCKNRHFKDGASPHSNRGVRGLIIIHASFLM